jgi:hypothetical protein
MAGLTWERTREPGIYKRQGARGTHYRVMTRDGIKRNPQFDTERRGSGWQVPFYASERVG